jgi:hypothetical protein
MKWLALIPLLCSLASAQPEPTYHPGETITTTVADLPVGDRVLVSIQTDAGVKLLTTRCEVTPAHTIIVKVPSIPPGHYHHHINLGQGKDKDFGFNLAER